MRVIFTSVIWLAIVGLAFGAVLHGISRILHTDPKPKRKPDEFPQQPEDEE